MIEQLQEDWQIVPFVDLTLHEESCDEGSEPIFERLWKGTIDGCDQREEEKKERYKVQTIKGYQQRHAQKDKASPAVCSEVIESIPPVN